MKAINLTSPFAAAFAVPMHFGNPNEVPDMRRIGRCIFRILAFPVCYCGLMLIAMIWLFNTRWRVAE